METFNISVGEPNPENSNTGHHLIYPSASRSIHGFAEVWFGDSQYVKKPDEALKYAKMMAAAPDLLEALREAHSIVHVPNELNIPLEARVKIAEILTTAIRKATE